jgi:hypothetical protein
MCGGIDFGTWGKEVAGEVVVTEVTVLLGGGLELGLDVAPNDEVVVVDDADGLADNTEAGGGDMEAVVVAEGVSETVDWPQSE